MRDLAERFRNDRRVATQRETTANKFGQGTAVSRKEQGYHGATEAVSRSDGHSPTLYRGNRIRDRNPAEQGKQGHSANRWSGYLCRDVRSHTECQKPYQP